MADLDLLPAGSLWRRLTHFGDSLNGVGGSNKRHNQPKTEYCERPFTEYYNLVNRCMIKIAVGLSSMASVPVVS